MITIGICDDEITVRKELSDLCTQILRSDGEEMKCIRFDSGEAVLQYCSNRSAEAIDVLFLDIEMPGLNGLEIRDRLLHNGKIAGIVFVTSHMEQMQMAFGKKTLGFLGKPAAEADLRRILNSVLAEQKRQTLFRLPGSDGARLIPTDCIYYFEGDGNYSTIYYFDERKEKCVSEVLVMKIGKLEKQLAEQHFVRIHKSYLVNLMQISNISDKATFHEIQQTLTVGRKYKKDARETFLEYAVGKVRERL